MKTIKKYLKNYKKESIFAPLFKMLEASFELVVPLIMARIVDFGIQSEDNTYIIKMGFVLLALGIVGLISSITAQFFSAKASVGVGEQLRRDLFQHIHRLSFTELDDIGTATLITRMTNDINQVQSGVNMFLRLFLRSPFIVLGAMIMAFTVNVKGAIVFVVVIPLLSVVVFGIMIYSIPLYKKMQKALDQVMVMTRENLIGVRVIRAFCRQEDEIKDFKNVNDTLLKIQIFIGKITSVLNPVTYILVNIAMIVILWISGNQVYIGRLTQGEVIALVNYMSQILIELIKLANLIILLTKAVACMKRIDEVFAVSSSILEHPTGVDIKKTDEKVRFQNVSFSYKDAKEPALENISFCVNKGETVGIIGGTGCGKSTLLYLIPRFYDATKGEVLVDDINVKKYSFHQLRNRIGFVLQKAVLFHGTIEDNLRWGKEDASKEEMLEAISSSQSIDVIQSKKRGLQEVLLQGGKNLSGGQRQRLTIARAIIRKPEILILDDATSALDYVTDSKLRKSLRKNQDNMTVFIASQRVDSIKDADQIIVLEDGKMVGIGKHEELIKTCQTYQEIVYSQEQIS